MRPEKPAKSWVVSGILSPKRQKWREQRRQWLKETNKQRLSGTDPISKQISTLSGYKWSEFFIGKLLVLFEHKSKKPFLLSTDNMGELRKCFLIGSNMCLASAEYVSSETSQEAKLQHQRKRGQGYSVDEGTSCSDEEQHSEQKKA